MVGIYSVLPTGVGGGRGQKGQFTLGLQCKGAPEQCQSCSNKIQFLSHIPV